MKSQFSHPLIILLALVGHATATPLQPVVLASRGQPSVEAGSKAKAVPVTLKQPLSAGSVLTTGPQERLAVAIAPGQLVSLDANSKLKVEAVHLAEPGHGAIIKLLQGIVRCSVNPELGHSAPVFTLIVKKESIQAQGTLWQTGIVEGTEAPISKTSTVVVNSTITVNIELSKNADKLSLQVSANSVLTSVYEAEVWQESKIVNLVTKLLTRYVRTGPNTYAVTTYPASETELGQALAALQTAIGQMGEVASNTLLTPPLSSSSTGNDTTVSPEQP